MKPGSIGDPDVYLGAKLRQVQLDNGVWAWGLSSSKYVNEAVKNVKEYMDKKLNRQLKTKGVRVPWIAADYHAETDESPELEPEMAN